MQSRISCCFLFRVQFMLCPFITCVVMIYKSKFSMPSVLPPATKFFCGIHERLPEYVSLLIGNNSVKD